MERREELRSLTAKQDDVASTAQRVRKRQGATLLLLLFILRNPKGTPQPDLVLGELLYRLDHYLN